MLPSVLPTETDHVPVLAEEVLAAVDPRPGQTIVDATFGAGGHSELLVGRLRGQGKLIAIDRDPMVAPYFERVRRSTAAKTRLLHGEFSQVLEGLAGNGVRADAVLLDLGVSSMQLDRPERGFSYAADAPLDMRMDPSARLTAADVVNETNEWGLADIFRRYGEERYARQIARAIVRRRATQPFERTGDLVEVIKQPCRLPDASGRGIRPSASSRRSGSRSTTSSRRWSAPSRRPSRCCAHTGTWR
jgi:16S rRNA (cytosine1402-N4)-methyltransferase